MQEKIELELREMIRFFNSLRLTVGVGILLLLIRARTISTATRE